MTWNLDDKLQKYIMDLHDSVDTILLGRKMTEGFVSYWENVVSNQPDSPEFSLAEKMVNTKKIIFTKTLDRPIGKNSSLAKGNLADEIANLKEQNGKDIIVYGGAGFVSSLIQEGLIDEYHLIVNPTAISNGMTIFNSLYSVRKFTPVQAKLYPGGKIVLSYKPKND
jgi:dihydrofolate reductase